MIVDRGYTAINLYGGREEFLFVNSVMDGNEIISLENCGFIMIKNPQYSRGNGYPAYIVCKAVDVIKEFRSRLHNSCSEEYDGR